MYVYTWLNHEAYLQELTEKLKVEIVSAWRGSEREHQEDSSPCVAEEPT